MRLERIKPERIVIIDDNASDAAIVRRLLGRAGYNVHYASSGAEGLDLIQAEPPDCVLVDYRMPGMDGYEVTRKIKSDAATQNIPVLMLTGADSARNLVEGFESGADDYVTKGVDFEVVLARVRALLRVKAYQDELRQHYQRLRNDLEFARRVQESLLPNRQFHSGHVEIRSAYIPSETLSGDFYDFFESDGTLFLLIADVSGHGLPAAILVSLLKSFFHSEAPETGPAEFMSRLNTFLATASLPSQFATAQLFRLSQDGRRMTFSTAAHPPFLLYRRSTGEVTQEEIPGHLLGITPGAAFEEHEIGLEEGDLLFCYTDGLTDRRTEAGEFYPIERIAEIITSNGERSCQDIYQAIIDDVTAFSPVEDFRDDVAFTVARIS
ncbi:MAG TPA: fused response regulator/phosphatase [Thermoanaerobaculia bacterium]|nr:fused response regulator/phosphatase [Thermoanaerobaculia bacterium]